MSFALFINTPLQPGDWTNGGDRNRFNGFSQELENVETVSHRLGLIDLAKARC